MIQIAFHTCRYIPEVHEHSAAGLDQGTQECEANVVQFDCHKRRKSCSAGHTDVCEFEGSRVIQEFLVEEHITDMVDCLSQR
jgi:hypothetical protein